MRVVCRFSMCLVMVVVLVPAADVAGDEDLPPIHFSRQIRPLLSDACFQCHGPDEKQRQADLRLDRGDGLAAASDESGAIVPGNPDASELYRRITSDDPLDRMPPPDSGKELNAEQIELIRRWIEQGAEWEEHWAFVPPAAVPPEVTSPWINNEIDRFILERLVKGGLSPSPEADRITLLRRVSFDLTGLPPTPEEVATFLADDSPDAYERQVDRLLDSPRFGERMAALWLDLARYADTDGYQTDGDRDMWRWREWVINAFNDNMPYDRFTIEQIAGDLLPDPSLNQLIATGFNRNHRLNAEGGVIPEEYLVEYVVDRVETTGSVWLGLTLGCARCHDHKYDPISQREFFELFAFFHNVPESGRAIKHGNSPPLIPAPTQEQQQQLQQLEARLAAAKERFETLQPKIERSQRRWERNVGSSETIDWLLPDGGQVPIDLAEAEFPDGAPALADAPRGQAVRLDGSSYADAGDVGDFGYLDKFSLSAWIFPDDKQGGTILSRIIDAGHDRAQGYRLQLHDGRLHLHFVVRWLDDAIRVATVDPVPVSEWTHVTMAYDGSRIAEGVRLYVNGERQELEVQLDALNQDFRAKEPFRIGAGGGPEVRFHGLIGDVRLFDRALSEEDARILAETASVSRIVGTAERERTAPQRLKLRRYFLSEVAPEPIRDAWGDLVALQNERGALIESFPTVMIMQEMPTPRETYVLERGEYDKPAERVTAAVPQVLHSLPNDASPNRLDLARWLVDRDNPLTARVAVNRFWEMLFGVGLVKTSEDFGSQGEPPSHPELLDWLALEFQRDWDVKRLLRRIVTSNAYRQSSRSTPEQLRVDPENRLLSRGPRFRLPAEMIRDQALAVSGLLVEEMGGPSVKPYQPEGLWRAVASAGRYRQDSGEKLYRRSLYTFWKRTVAPPGMTTFDATGRETCTVRRSRTNTPLQALTLLNDVTYVEAARKLAERMMTEPTGEDATGDASVSDRIAHGFRLATGRPPTDEESAVLEAGFRKHLETYRNAEEHVDALLNVGESPPTDDLNRPELAAYTITANLILNLDEMVMKE
jgi:hypothetical protein